MRSLRLQAVLMWMLMAVLLWSGFAVRTQQDLPRELTVERITVVDSMGNTRVILAGSFPPRRTRMAGLLFVHPSGVEAGGLVYAGEERNGVVDAGGLLTFDKFGDDQIVALQSIEQGGRRTQGLIFQDRPDSLGPEILSYYRRIDPLPAGPERDSLVAEMLRTVPSDQLSARRMFVGRNAAKSSVVRLADRRGTDRLRMEVDSLGNASIVFLDANGTVVRTITP